MYKIVKLGSLMAGGRAKSHGFWRSHLKQWLFLVAKKTTRAVCKASHLKQWPLLVAKGKTTWAVCKASLPDFPTL